jgi:hypothetical protein
VDDAHFRILNDMILSWKIQRECTVSKLNKYHHRVEMNPDTRFSCVLRFEFKE